MGVGGMSVISSGSPLVTTWHRCAVVDRPLVVLGLSRMSIGRARERRAWRRQSVYLLRGEASELRSCSAL